MADVMCMNNDDPDAGMVSSQDHSSDQIQKWQAISRMIEHAPDAVPFRISATGPEMRWAFLGLAMGLFPQNENTGLVRVTPGRLVFSTGM
jgi:hypothetical protein